MERQPSRHDYSAEWDAMESNGYAIIHGRAEPLKQHRESILTETKRLTPVEVEDSPLFYIQPEWGTEPWVNIKNYVEHGINVRLCEYKTSVWNLNKLTVCRSLQYKP